MTMDEPKNRRTDHQGPKTPLRWGERWTLLLTSPTSGIVGQYGATWPGQPAHYERVNVYAEGAAKLDDIEQYRLQMAAIGTASLGYWKEGDSIHPDYDTVPAARRRPACLQSMTSCTNSANRCASWWRC
jgi:hypothetical protein